MLTCFNYIIFKQIESEEREHGKDKGNANDKTLFDLIRQKVQQKESGNIPQDGGDNTEVCVR